MMFDYNPSKEWRLESFYDPSRESFGSLSGLSQVQAP
jgi:hypothetical protein